MMRLAMILALAIAVLAGCSRSPAPAEGSAVAATAQVNNNDNDDPCQLLQVAEVEAVLGSLAGPPYRSDVDKPDPRGDSCRYVGQDLHSIRLSVSRTEGPALLKMMGLPGALLKQLPVPGKVPAGILPADSTFAGDWDDIRVIGCCTINVFLGEAMVGIDFIGSRGTRLQGVTLVNKALQRLDKPISTIDGRAGISLAMQRNLARQKHPTVCQLVTRAEAEMLLGAKLTADPSADDDKCSYRYTGSKSFINEKGGMDTRAAEKTVSVTVSWTYGFENFRLDREIAGQAVRTVSQVGAVGAATPTDKPIGPWDDAVMDHLAMLFKAVKKDISVKVNADGDAELAEKFATKAMEKL